MNHAKTTVGNDLYALQKRLGTPLSRGLRSQKGLRPFNPLQKSKNKLQTKEMTYLQKCFSFFVNNAEKTRNAILNIVPISLVSTMCYLVPIQNKSKSSVQIPPMHKKVSLAPICDQHSRKCFPNKLKMVQGYVSMHPLTATSLSI